MPKAITHRGTIALAITAALLVTAFAAASSADASTLYACVKKNGTARIFTQKPKCKKGERKLSWNNPGPSGRNGLNGANGLNGVNGSIGKEGATGKEGKPGAPGSALAYAHVNSDGTVDPANTSSNITNANITHALGSNYEFINLPFTPHSVTAIIGFGGGVNDDIYAAVLGPHAAGVAIYDKTEKETNDNFYIVFN
jgi:hypothetical protein